MVTKGIALDSDTVVNTLKACSMIGDVKTAFDVLQVNKIIKISKVNERA